MMFACVPGEGMIFLHSIVFFFLMKSYFIEELFYDTLHSEEVAFAIHTKCELYSFIRQFCKLEVPLEDKC